MDLGRLAAAHHTVALGVAIDVDLARQLADLEHELVGQGARRARGSVAESPAARHVERTTETDGHPPEGMHHVRSPAAGRRSSPTSAHGDHSGTAARGRRRATPVWPRYRRPSGESGPLRIDAEDLASTFRTWRAAANARSEALPPSRRMGIWPAARKNHAVFHESKYSALATNVTPAADDERHEQRDRRTTRGWGPRSPPPCGGCSPDLRRRRATAVGRGG